MKIFKILLSCIIIALLVCSIIFNIILLNNSNLNQDASDLETDISPVGSSTETEQEVFVDSTSEARDSFEETNTNDNIFTAPIESTVSGDTNPSVEKLIYDDTNIKVYYVSTQIKDTNIIHNFKIENLTKKTLSFNFTDVTINGTRVYISGLTCENLLPETDTVEEFVLLEKDWGFFTESPEDISFKIELVNSKSRLSWYKSNEINIDFNPEV